MRLFSLVLSGLVFLHTGCVTMETRPTSLERQYNANSRSVYRAVIEVLEKEKIPLSTVDTAEPRMVTTEFVETKKLNQSQRYRFRIVLVELSEELTKVEIYYFQEYFDDFWKKEWIPMRPDGKAEEALFNQIDEYLKKEHLEK